MHCCVHRTCLQERFRADAGLLHGGGQWDLSMHCETAVETGACLHHAADGFDAFVHAKQTVAGLMPIHGRRGTTSVVADGEGKGSAVPLLTHFDVHIEPRVFAYVRQCLLHHVVHGHTRRLAQ